MSKLFTAIASILFLPCLAEAGILINPVVSVSSDTTNALATITISLYAGGDGDSRNVNSYTVDALLTDITPALTSVTLNSPSAVASGVWSSTNFTNSTTAEIITGITGNTGFRFSGSTGVNGPNVSVPAVQNTSIFLLGQATLTAARPSIGSGTETYSINLTTYMFLENPSAQIFDTSDSTLSFYIAAQTAGGAAVPEPASVLVLLGGAVGFGWRRMRSRK